MGHQRPNYVPPSTNWNGVVDAFLTGNGLAVSDLPNIAATTLGAAEKAIADVNDDTGVCYAFYLLTQVAIASRSDNWLGSLRQVGIHLRSDSTLFDLTSEVQYAIDDHIAAKGRPTDISEMAQSAAGEALASLAGDKSTTLFGSTGDELRYAVKSLSTTSGFSDLGQRFFGSFVSRFLNFYLARITARHVGSSRLPTIADTSAFSDALNEHCHQSARITRDFCGKWYSKTEYEGGINPLKTSQFMAIAVRKLSRELKKQSSEL